MASRRRRPVAAPGLGCGSTALFFLTLSLLLTPECALAQSASSINAGGGGSSNNNGNNNYENYFGAAKFNPSMAVVVVVLVTAFFLVGFFSIYLRNCVRATDESSARIHFAGNLAARSQRSKRLRGLRPEVLETFPTMEYSEVKEHKVGKGALECAVCISEFEDDDNLRLLPACSHIFHADCIDAWLASHVTCPVCRFDLSEAIADHVVLNVVEVVSPRPTSVEVQIDVPATVTNGAPQPERATIVVEPISETEEEEEEQYRREEAMELAELRSRKRELRSRSGRRPSKFPRSHSTGHSLTNQTAGECDDRYTLRLPEHVLREIMATKKLHRSASCVAFPTAQDGSSRPGYRSGGAGEGSSRGGRSVRGPGKLDRWPSFFMRTLSAKFPSWRRGGDGEASVKKG